jgi:hypothetical protein
VHNESAFMLNIADLYQRHYKKASVLRTQIACTTRRIRTFYMISIPSVNAYDVYDHQQVHDGSVFMLNIADLYQRRRHQKKASVLRTRVELR